MSDRIYMNVAGLSELSAALRAMPPAASRRVLRSGASAGAALIRNEMRALAPIYYGTVAQGHPPPGTLAKSVYMQYIPEKSGPTRATYYIGCRHGKARQHVGKKDRNLDAYYFFMVELGTKFMSKHPFMRPAFETKKVAAVYAIQERVGDGIAEAVSEVRK